MNILWVSSEAVPYAKTGGLADVSGALPEALAARGHQVDVVLPWYPQVTGKLNLEQEFTYSDPLGVPFGETTEWARIRTLSISRNLRFHFIEFDRFFDRPRLYDWDGVEYGDNAQRFIFFSRAAMQTVIALDLHPDVIHANDWHAALCCVYLRSDFYARDPHFSNARSVLTIHNIGYQGVFGKENLYWTGLGWGYFHFNCLEYYDQLNFLKAGVLTAHMVNAVSPTYACEILSPEYGFSLDPALRCCVSAGRLRGILNGIDVAEWDPEHDKLLPTTFTADDLSGKAVCKAALQKHFSLPVRADVPLFATISRLAYQKGLDVMAAAVTKLLENGADIQCVVVGAGDSGLENWFRSVQDRFPGKFAFFCGYAPDKVSHLVEAGADIFVMPSRYEPCGLNQMYSMRYGTLPLVRGTGGLADTVTSFKYTNTDTATGFVFYDLNSEALANTMRWAAEVRQSEPEAFTAMIRNAMRKDLSWNNTASQYEQMYKDAHR